MHEAKVIFFFLLLLLLQRSSNVTRRDTDASINIRLMTHFVSRNRRRSVLSQETSEIGYLRFHMGQI